MIIDFLLALAFGLGFLAFLMLVLWLATSHARMLPVLLVAVLTAAAFLSMQVSKNTRDALTDAQKAVCAKVSE